jgi:phage repressor protein C with HTH and peptisase S24 domain
VRSGFRRKPPSGFVGWANPPFEVIADGRWFSPDGQGKPTLISAFHFHASFSTLTAYKVKRLYVTGDYFGTASFGMTAGMANESLDLIFRSALEQVLNQQGRGAQAKLARSTKISASYLNDILRGRTYGSEETRRQIARALGMEYEEFLNYGRRVLKIPAQSSEMSCAGSEFTYVPKVRPRLMPGGLSFEMSDALDGIYAFRTDYLKNVGQPKDMVLFEVSGDSMDPEIKHGDTVLVDKSQHEVIPGNIYGIGIDEEVVVRRVEKSPGQIVLVSENSQKYQPIGVVVEGQSSVRIIGRVIWMGRKM